MRKLTIDEIWDIRRLHAEGWSKSKLAKKFGIKIQDVQRIIYSDKK